MSDAQRWLAVIGGGPLVLYGLARRSLGGTVLALAGGALVYRGVTGRWPVSAGIDLSRGRISGKSMPGAGPIRVEKAVTVNRSPEELYRFWRDFENLPRFMDHLESVTATDGKRSRWVAKAPLGTMVEWDAEVVDEKENELIAWRSVEGADVDNRGTVRFIRAPGRRGTEVRVSLAYDAPGGAVGAAFARLFGEEPAQQVAADLRRFKQLVEAGEIATTEAQPSARR